ncbi:MAG: hypothetical protein LBL47_02065 [Lactobacillus sp.]|jgi:fructose-1,6-bisphosphatase/inositol monophosphatase family enzyme|nr:hypothetical protein [Lactobacillus sp.]
MLNKLLDFAKTAGKIALDNQEAICKSDNKLKERDATSVVTKTDFEISVLFKKFIEDNFSDLNYMIIDEETITEYGDKMFSRLDETEYQFVIDPIDGTMPYANMMPLWGIVIGVLKNKKPHCGIVYIPKLKDMVYSDGEKAFWVQNAFDEDECVTELHERSKSASAILFMHNWKFELTDKFCRNFFVPIDFFAAAVLNIYIITDRAKANVFHDHLWDFAGAMSVMKCVGLKMLDYDTKKEIEISAEYFDNKMCMKGNAILCYEDDFDTIKSMIRPRILL